MLEIGRDMSRDIQTKFSVDAKRNIFKKYFSPLKAFNEFLECS